MRTSLHADLPGMLATIFLSAFVVVPLGMTVAQAFKRV
jgi:hypothetical protein